MKLQDDMARTFSVSDNLMEKFWDMWLVGLSSISWTQEQHENMVKKYLEQSKSAREESGKIIAEMAEQVKNNQMQMKKMVQEAVAAALEHVEMPAYNMFDDINKKIDELSRRVDNM